MGVTMAEQPKPRQSVCVVYRPVRCPSCDSKNVRTTSTRKPVRHHKCRDCQTNFRSFEE